jgi:hypothetical protein
MLGGLRLPTGDGRPRRGFQLGQHLQPNLRALRAVTDSQAQDVAFPVHGDADNHIDRFVPDLPLAYTRKPVSSISGFGRVPLSISGASNLIKFLTFSALWWRNVAAVTMVGRGQRAGHPYPEAQTNRLE